MTSIVTTNDFRNALRSRDRAAINRLAARLLDQRTFLGEQWCSIALVLLRTGEVALAVSAAERAVDESKGSANARFQLANVLANVGRQDEAVALVSAIAPEQLDRVARDHFLGTCAMEVGDFEGARAAFDQVVAGSPASAPSWLSLAALPPSDDVVLLDRLNAASSAIEATPSDYRAQWHYAKGAILDRLERIDEAFSEFAAGAELVRSVRAYDREADRSEVETLIAGFTRAAVSEIAGQVQTDASRPILVTGLPRSGTTLVEQILTSHSTVAGGGEMPFGSILKREIRGNSLSSLESFVAANGADHLTRLYLHLADEQFGEQGRFVDKCLGTNRELGVLASVLPQARIIWLRRDPLDCAWSCFRTYFSDGIEWSWSLADIAVHFEAEDRLYAHWREVLGDRMLTLSYEGLAANPKEQIALVLDHLGLDSEPAMEAVHRTRRVVTTASVAQVRQPVYLTSIGTAHRYRAHLEPFIDAYEATALAG